MAVVDQIQPAEAAAPGDSASKTRNQPTPSAFVLALALFAIYVVASLFTDPDGYLSTDVGGKTASLEAMVERGDWDLDIGYWFEDADPDGEFFPYAHTTFTPNGQWVNTTSLTMVYAARPLWEISGARLAMLLPILGGVFTALAGRALERRLVPGATGTVSFWAVGLATPAFVYALDFWEHTLGLAGMAFGVVATHDALHGETQDGDRPIRSALLAGLAFGFAATMRQEALVYGVVAGLLLVVSTGRRNDIGAAVRRGGSMIIGTLLTVGAHTAAEYALLGAPLRLTRSSGTVGQSATGPIDRLRAAVATTLFPFNGDHPLSYGFGVLLLIGLAWVTHQVLTGRTDRLPRLLLIVAVVFCGLFYAVFGPRFVPGLVATTPLAVVGAVAAIRRRASFVLVLAVAPLPLVFLVQFPDGAIPQWGGRYLLLSGFVLTVAAVAYMADHRRFLASVAAGAVAVTLFGVVFTVIRKDDVTDDWQTIERVTDDGEVVVWRNFVDAREAGPELIGERWLSAPDDDRQQRIVPLMIAAGIDQFVWIGDIEDGVADFEGYEHEAQLGTLDFFTHRIDRYVRAG